MAGSYLYIYPESKYDYIADVFDTLIVRDIRQKYKIRNTQLMDRIVDFLMEQDGRYRYNYEQLLQRKNLHEACSEEMGIDGTVWHDYVFKREA